ncbi:MAG TPA: hypothetical protein VGL61_27945 [Kofleriaceae bacterium]|jgi:hypothetical protein
MKLEDILPGHCLAHAVRLLADVALVRDELGRAEDARAPGDVSNAKPRDCYFEALAAWNKAARLGAELGAPASRFVEPTPPAKDISPGHVLGVIDAIGEQLAAIKTKLHITEASGETTVDSARQPGDVLGVLIRVNRQLSRCLERPFAPSDCYHVVALASAYATRLGSHAELAPFERRRQPRHCFERLLACHQVVSAAIGKRGQQATSAPSLPADVLPGDVYDLANLVLAEVAFLHSLTPNATPVQAFELAPSGYRLPAHVDQLARTLHAQLSALPH